jgi:hypothetical protein
MVFPRVAGFARQPKGFQRKFISFSMMGEKLAFTAPIGVGVEACGDSVMCFRKLNSCDRRG